MILEIERLGPNVPVPTKATALSACYDLSFHLNDPFHISVDGYKDVNSPEKCIVISDAIRIPPGWRMMVPTGLKLFIPRQHHVKVYSRSSVALKRGLVVVNSVGIIDEDYHQPLYVLLHNVSNNYVVLAIGERIGQFEICQTTDIVFWDTVEGAVVKGGSLSKRDGGLGSTGNF